MRKIITLLFCLSMFFAVLPLYSQAYTTNLRSRKIHVVYDDTVTMFYDEDETGNKFVDRWGQAKYAMEVFAAMLEENDKMDVYYMGDFNVNFGGSLNAPARITISGSEPSAARVKQIHDTVTIAGGTPYDAVSKAYADLRNAAADEKWLVILTDGQFNVLDGRAVEEGSIDVGRFFSQYINESDVRIIFLAIGNIKPPVISNPDGRIFVRNAGSSNEIRKELTDICNLIFNRNRLELTDETRYEFTFDIPMIELLIFAQGANVRINGIRGDRTFSPSETPVNVRFSERAAANLEDIIVYRYGRRINEIIISRDLIGNVATFRNFPNIPKGTYSLDISGAQTVPEIYYKPDVNLGIKLYRGNRDREITTQEIEEGAYRIDYGIVNEDGEFFESTLLGNIKYTATVQNGGRIIPIEKGESVNLTEGELRVRVQADFLDINTAENSITRRVLVPPTFRERFLNWIKKYWYIFWPLVILLAGLLLYLWLWGTKKRFPKYMRGKRPNILVESDGNTIETRGSFKINMNSKLMPFCAETGTIVAAADGKPLPPLKVRALRGKRMELINTGDFAANRLGGVEFYINDRDVPEGTSKNREMSCTSKIKSVYYSSGGTITHTCSFTGRGR